MKKKIGKSARIREYLELNPDATWKLADADLSKFGITGQYFAMIKSKNKAQSSVREINDDVLDLALEFAKRVGCIDTAIEALGQLKKYQV